MIEKNRAEFTKCNILKWREAGYTGNGATVVVLDTPHKPYLHTNVIDPFNNNNSSYGHKGQVAQVIREVAPDAKIVVFSWTRSGKQEIIDWIAEHEKEITCINVSLALNTSLDMFEQLKIFDIPVFLATGNGSKDKVQKAATYDWLIAVGAWEEHRDKRASYSNYGKELDIVTYTNIYITTTKTTMLFNGTSCATPMASAMLAIYTDWRIKNGLPKLTRKEAYDFVTTSVVDKNTAGFDNESGYGLFVLPKEIPTIKKTEETPVEVVEPMPVKVNFDAGHGGEDTGGYSGGIREKDLTLPVARRVRELLKSYNPGMTRTEDTLLIWNKRAALIKDQYDYCISIHFNIGGGSGVEAIHSAYSERGKKLATFLVDEVSSYVGIPKRPNPVFSKKQSDGQDYYYMHRLTGRTTTVILEIFFLDNDADKMFMNLEKISRAIANGFKKFIATQTIFLPPTATNPYTIRRYNSDVHVFEARTPMQTRVTLGQRFKLETVTDIVANEIKQGQKVLAAINCGFFTGASNEHTTLLIANGLYYNPPSINTVDFIYYKDGRTEVTNLHGYDQAVLSKLQNDCHFAIGTSYALVINGKKNLMLAEKFSHSTTKQPRTMIGQTADKRMILVVTDGRVRDSAGLTADEQADLMLELGCINAVNLDGGGSSTMVITRGSTPIVYNELYEGYERPVGSVIIVKEA
jgi:exopolysaccharide biosynthesis protein/N-acetylmuramoyl-L-alanine amidase